MKLVTEQKLALLCLFALGVGASRTCSDLRADDAPRTDTIDTIRRAWSARQSRFSSIDYCYKTHDHQLRELLLSAEQLAKAKSTPKPGEPVYLDYATTTRLLIQGGSIRYELTGDTPGDEATLYERESLQTSNGMVSKSLNKKGMHRYPTGFINKEPTNRCLTAR